MRFCMTMLAEKIIMYFYWLARNVVGFITATSGVSTIIQSLKSSRGDASLSTQHRSTVCSYYVFCLLYTPIDVQLPQAPGRIRAKN